MRSFLLALIFYVGLDMVWVGLIGKRFIERQVGAYLSPRVDWLAAVLFYLIFALGLTYFAILPAKTSVQALLNGALLGLLAYGTYELVNRALLADWPWKLVVVDICYGVVACGLVAWVVWELRS